MNEFIQRENIWPFQSATNTQFAKRVRSEIWYLDLIGDPIRQSEGMAESLTTRNALYETKDKKMELQWNEKIARRSIG